jgi:hypothetical protein
VLTEPRESTLDAENQVVAATKLDEPIHYARPGSWSARLLEHTVVALAHQAPVW